MALIIKTATAESTSGFSWDAWYAKNRVRLSEKRALRYKVDAAYREAALKRSRAQRKSKLTLVVNDDYTVAFNEAADQLGVTVWVLREWRRKNYFPEPLRRNGRLWFKPSQVQLLQKLQQFFAQHGVRVAEANRQDLEEMSGLVYANW